MSAIKEKLQSESGSSMLLMLVFLLFSMFIGSALLSSAAANSARAAQMEQDRQASLTQRSAMLVLSQLLEDTPQLTVRDVTTPSRRRVTFSVPEGELSCLQELLCRYAAGQYAAANFVAAGDMEFDNFSSTQIVETAGTVEIALQSDDRSETILAEYVLSGDGDLWIGLVSLHLTVTCTAGTGAPVRVTVEDETRTTVTTVIHWEDPVIGKGGPG